MALFEAAGDVVDFGEVEVDVAVFVVGEEGVDRVGVELFVEGHGAGQRHFEGLLVDAQYAAFVGFGVVEQVAQFGGNTVF